MMKSARRLALYLVLTIVILTFFLMMTPHFVADGLDPSWQAALLQARYLNLGFGNQIIFSGGPLSHVYSRIFSSSLFYERLFAILLFTAFYVLFFANAAARNRNLFLVMVGALPFLLSLLTDPIYVGLPLCAALLGTLPVQGARVRLLVVLGAFASAVATLAKFSVFPMAIVGFLIVDMLAISNRRLPLALIAYGLSIVGVFFFTSPNGVLLEFIRNSWDVSSGYSEAMSLSGSTVEAGLIFAGAAIIVAMVALSELRNAYEGELPFTVAFGRVAMIGIFFLVGIKGGLVRHDAHALIAWSGLGFVAATYCAFCWRELSPRLAAGFVALAVASVVFTSGSWKRYAGVSVYDVVSGQVSQRQQDVANWLDFLSGPRLWMASQQLKQQAAYANIRAKHPLPALDGTVDSIPSVQSSLIANGFRYQPRPSIQEYATYTHGLIEKNRAFFRSDKAPDFVLMAPETLDSRHPGFTEGSIWPDLLARYAPQDVADGLVILHKRDRPLDLPMRTVQTLSGTLEKTINFESGLQGIIFAHIDLQPTFWGRLASLVFKSAILFADVEYTDGSQARYRFIPAIAREGFFLSPLISSSEAYFGLATGLAAADPRRVKSFTIRPSTLAKWLWSNEYIVKLDAMKDDALRSDAVNLKLSSYAKQRLDLLSVIHQNSNAKLSILSEGLLAHAPTKLNVPVNAGHTLDVGFGILDGAWTGDANTDGVCFRVIGSNSLTIWQRCLAPKYNTIDRGMQHAEIAVPEGAETLVLETLCGQHCAWDWSYWSRISLR